MLAKNRLAGLGQPADGAVAVHDAELEFGAGGGGQQRARLLLEPGPVLLVNKALQQVGVGQEISGLVPTNPLARWGDIPVASVGACQNSKS